jgi:hypothetical protein
LGRKSDKRTWRPAVGNTIFAFPTIASIVAWLLGSVPVGEYLGCSKKYGQACPNPRPQQEWVSRHSAVAIVERDPWTLHLCSLHKTIAAGNLGVFTSRVVELIRGMLNSIMLVTCTEKVHLTLEKIALLIYSRSVTDVTGKARGEVFSLSSELKEHRSHCRNTSDSQTDYNSGVHAQKLNLFINTKTLIHYKGERGPTALSQPRKLPKRTKRVVWRGTSVVWEHALTKSWPRIHYLF